MTDHNETECDFCKASMNHAQIIRQRIHIEGVAFNGAVLRDAFIEMMATVFSKHNLEVGNISEAQELAVIARIAAKGMALLISGNIQRVREQAMKEGKPLDYRTVQQMQLHGWQSLRMAICAVADFADCSIEFGFNPSPCQAFPGLTVAQGTAVS